MPSKFVHMQVDRLHEIEYHQNIRNLKEVNCMSNAFLSEQYRFFPAQNILEACFYLENVVV